MRRRAAPAFTAFFLGSLVLFGAPARAAKPPKKKPAAAPAPTYALPLLAATTEEITVPLVLERLETLDRDLKSLSAGFRQFVRWDDSGVSQSVEGTLDYRKKDLLRLDQRLPEPQTVVADGQWLWIWRRETNQVLRSKLAEWKKSEPLAQGLLDFGNYAALLRRYEVSVATVSAPGPDGHRAFELLLLPKEKGGDFSLRFKLSTRDYFPADAELKAGAVRVRSVFSDVRFNPPLDDGLFRFTPPAGADLFLDVKPPTLP